MSPPISDTETPLPGGPADEDVLSVAELTHQVKELLEGAYPSVWVEGEISNFKRPRSGHLYFTLKDEDAALSAVMFRYAAGRLGFEPGEGEKVLAFGQITVYPPRGNYQLRVTRMVPRGQGALQAAFEKLRARLQAEGLFDPARKRPLPVLPRKIGVVTSGTGAAIHDILRVLRRRDPGVDVVLAPSRVQGAGAADEIAGALARLVEVPGIEVVIVGRGGGSLEDLWAFNEEAVARALFACPLPVISAVGHEVDVTIADMVADRRAPTPSAAAEIVVPERRDIELGLLDRVRRQLRATRQRLRREGERVARATRTRTFRDPFTLLETRAQRVDELTARMHRALRHRVERARDRIQAAERRLHAVGPQEVLDRGYAVLTREDDTTPLRDPGELTPGDRVTARLARGPVLLEVPDDGPGKKAPAKKPRARKKKASKKGRSSRGRKSREPDENQGTLFPRT